MDAKIFKAYDIRGIYPGELDSEAAYLISRAFATFLSCRKVVVGYDMRESSMPLFDSVVRGLVEQGADVVDIGMCSTPMCYYANHSLGADASVMITASHNPKEYNGLKLCREKAIPLSGDTGIMQIRDIAEKKDFAASQRKGRVITHAGLLEEYRGFVQKSLSGHKWGKRLRVVADFANAMGSVEAGALKGLEIELIPMFEELDSSFPSHEANPLKTETLAELRKRVVAENADMGIAFDGDADRIGFVDEKGDIVPMDLAMGVMAQEILADNPGGTVLYDLRSSRAVKEAIEEAGGRAVMCRVGHSFIKQQMRKENAVFAGELAGHYYFAQNSYAESTALAAGRMMAAAGAGKLSELVAPLRKYFHSGEINSEVGDKDAVLAELERRYSDGRISKIDGLLVEYPDWWFSVRASNTEPLLRLNLEARDRSRMERMQRELLSLIRRESPAKP